MGARDRASTSARARLAIDICNYITFNDPHYPYIPTSLTITPPLSPQKLRNELRVFLLALEGCFGINNIKNIRHKNE